jgi:CheY-like chemotaxis protein
VSVRLLLIEDNPGDALIFREKIGASPLETSLVVAARLRDALDQLEGGAFDLVLVDLSLPDAQGLEAVDRVRKAVPHLPLIVLTGLDDAATAAEAKKRGAVDYLVKWYVDSPSLARYIRYAIEQYRLLGDGGGPLAPGEPPAPRAEETSPAATPAAAGPEAAAAPAAAPAADVAVSPAEAPREAPVPGGDADGAGVGLPGAERSAFVAALEAALDVAAQTAARAEHLAGSLRAALELARGDAERQAPRREPLDLLGLAQQAADRARARALHSGIPVRVHADRKKVLAKADRRAVCDAFDRLFAVALATGCGSGLRVAVAPERTRAVVAATWELHRGARLADTDDPLLALDLALCRRFAARAGGTFALTEEPVEAAVVLAFDAPSHG